MSYPVWPTYRIVLYKLDGVSGWYLKEPTRIAFAKMPQRMKVEETQDPRIRFNGATELIHGPEEGGKWKFFTGLVPLDLTAWYQGDAYEYRSGVKSQSMILFRFMDNDATLMVYYFTGFWIHNRNERLRFANAFAQHVEQRGTTENGNGGA